MPHLPGDGDGRARVVTGDHLDADAGPQALGDGRDGLGARRVHDADDTDELQAGPDVGGVEPGTVGGRPGAVRRPARAARAPPISSIRASQKPVSSGSAVPSAAVWVVLRARIRSGAP
ncbi:hypothetical protein [Streptomyces sp. KL116D]|uniref:hypothetical protein n=1 Tax=Streptomyces sp. KL116D TaxID=3045152 RepID=UPI003558C481